MADYQLTQPGAKVQKDLNAIENLANAYSADATYAVGDLVFYNGQLYRCISAITTAEAWNADHWTSMNLQSLLSAPTAQEMVDYLGGNASIASVEEALEDLNSGSGV